MISFIEVLICVFFDIDMHFRSHLQPMMICSKLGTFKSSNVLTDLPRRIAFIGSPIQLFHKAMSKLSLLKMGISAWIVSRGTKVIQVVLRRNQYTQIFV